MITRIYADNYRCFSNFTFEPKRLNLLVGDNGSGKSALVELIIELHQLALRSDALRGWLLPSSRTRWDARTTQRFELQYVDKDGATFDWMVTLAPKASDAAVNAISSEIIKKDGAVIAELEGGPNQTLRVRGMDVPLPYLLEASLLALLVLRLTDPDLVTLSYLVANTAAFKLDVLRIGEMSPKANGSVDANCTSFPSNYRSMRMKDFDRTKQLHVALANVIGGFRSLDLESVGGEAERLVVKLFAEQGKPDYSLGFTGLSDGQRALVVLYYLVTMFDLTDRPIFIDEPDNYISLRELQPWLQALSLAVEDQNAQAFIISHHPEVIDYLAAGDAWLFERADGGPVRPPRQLPIDRDSGLTASQQLARGWIHGS